MTIVGQRSGRQDEYFAWYIVTFVSIAGRVCYSSIVRRVGRASCGPAASHS